MPSPVRAHFEVLLRLPDERGGVQPAAAFLPQAERYSLMPSIDRWVIRRTVMLLGKWRREHPDSELPLCSLNLSSASLQDHDLVDILRGHLTRQQLPAEALCFEISEVAALANVARASSMIEQIREVGCRIALEDVGSGASSFAYLKALRVNYLKIGGQLVRRVGEDAVNSAIIGALNQVGKSMGMATIAKEVDSVPSLRTLRGLGVEYAQGHALAHPSPLTDPQGRVSIPPVFRSRSVA